MRDDHFSHSSDRRRVVPAAAIALMVAQLVLMFVSWLYSAAFPDSGVHSLLSGEGIRWFMGQFTRMMATPVLSGILLLAMAYGSLRHCRLWPLGRTYRERRALVISVGWLVVYVVAVLLLSVTPHAVLLSASGSLWPSPFSASVVPVVAFGGMTFGWSYGTIAGHYRHFDEVYSALLQGIGHFAPALFFYVLVTQFYESLRFVLP